MNDPITVVYVLEGQVGEPTALAAGLEHKGRRQSDEGGRARKPILQTREVRWMTVPSIYQ